MEATAKKDYICVVPFTSLEIHDHKRFLCCASWLTKYLPEDSSPKDAWNSKEANEIRTSILDGTYTHCDSNQCPFLHQLETIGPNGNLGPLYQRKDLSPHHRQLVDNFEKGNTIDPENIQFSFDRSCNLKCPSCRIEVIMANSQKIKEVKATIEEIENTYSHSITRLYITGSGDPFISVGFRDFLRNFNPKKYPKLKNIHLHTNATYWTKKMWESMPNIHPYVTTCEISIDAATKDTYENKTRIGGDWNKLINNLHFINTIKKLKRVKTSFVVQRHNYKEMKMFYDLMNDIFGKKADVFFGKINNWGTFTEEEYVAEQVWNPTHSEYNLFIKEVNKVLPAHGAWTNLQEFLLHDNKQLL